MNNPDHRGIFVTGLPRSGTSLVAGILQRSGAWLGTTVGADQNNPKGYFENAYVRERIVKVLLSRMQCDPLGVRKLPPLFSEATVPDLGQAFLSLLEQDGYTRDRGPWLYKDAKLTLLWPTFLTHFPQADWIVVRRDLGSFIASCRRTKFMAQHSVDEKFWLQFAAEYLKRLDGLRDMIAASREIWPDELFTQGPTRIRPIIEGLGLRYEEEHVSAFLNQAYWRSSLPPSNGPTLPKIKHYMSGAGMPVGGSVAVVGNSDSLKGQGLGARIDQYDHVFRFNLAPVDERFHADVGSKSTCYLLSRNVTTWKFPTNDEQVRLFRRICEHADIICYPGHYERILEFRDPYHLEVGFNDVNEVFRDALHGDYEPFPRNNHPRNGIKLLAAFLHAGIKPTLFGFDLGNRPVSTHYYDDEVQQEAKDGEGGHRPSLEYRLLHKLRQKGLIEVVEAPC